MYKLSADVMIHIQEDKKFLVNILTGKVYELNDIATLIIEGIQGNQHIEHIKNYIYDMFPDVSEEKISSDVDIYIQMLHDSEAIKNA